MPFRILSGTRPAIDAAHDVSGSIQEGDALDISPLIGKAVKHLAAIAGCKQRRLCLIGCGCQRRPDLLQGVAFAQGRRSDLAGKDRFTLLDLVICAGNRLNDRHQPRRCHCYCNDQGELRTQSPWHVDHLPGGTSPCQAVRAALASSVAEVMELSMVAGACLSLRRSCSFWRALLTLLLTVPAATPQISPASS